jgi:hypothetical protein
MAENRELALVLKLVADQFQSELRNSQGALGSFTHFIKDWKTQVTAAGTALFAIAKSTANYGDELVKMSQKLGTTVEDTARLQHAARLSDTDLQGLSASVGFLSKNMLEASQGNVEAQRTFERLGISTTDANGQLKGTTAVLLELNDKFRLMPDGPEKTALAMKALGKSGKDVIPLLNSDMREAFTEAEKLGLVMSDKAARAAEHFNDELTKLQGAIRGVTNDAGTALIPTFDAIAHALTTIITDAREAARAIAGLNKIDAPQVGVVKPPDGGKNLRILPKPEGIDKAVLDDPFFMSPEQAKQAAEQVRLGEQLREKHIALWNEITGKAKLDIFLAENRALEIQNRLARESSEGPNQDFLAFDRREQFRKEDEAAQERLGRMIVEQTQLEVSIRDAAAASERQQLVENLQTWVAYYDQVGGSAERRHAKELDLVRANLAMQTQLTTEEAGRLLIAWQNHDEQLAQQILARTTLTAQQKETIELQALARVAAANEQASEDIFAGWARGMERYVQDTKSGFGLAADMARRTAQAMEQSFRNFFFDLFEGRVKSLNDVLKGLLDFVKQIAAQIAAQLAVKFVLQGLGFGANTGGMLVQRFAMGGPVLGTGNRDTVPALLTPGEFVLSRKDVADIKRGFSPYAMAQAGNVTVNIHNAPADTTAVVNQRRAADGLVLDVILRNRRDLRPLLGGA